MSDRLYELAEEYRGFEQALYEAEGEITDDTAILADAMKAVKGEFDQKVENIAKIVMNLESDAQKFDLEIARLQKRKQSLLNNANRTKLWLKGEMEIAGIYKIKGEILSVGIQNSPPSIRDEDVDMFKLSQDYQVTKTEVRVDKKKILDEWKANGVIPEGVAKITQNNHLRIR